MFVQFGSLFLLLALGGGTRATSPTPSPPAVCAFDLDTANKTREPLHKFFVKLHADIVSHNPDKNIAYSPVSIALALALVEAGAAGQTQSELKNVLAPTSGFDGGDTSTLYESLQHQLKIQTPDVRLSVANSLFYDDAFTLKAEYVSKVAKCFETSVEKVDFHNQHEQARRKINSWVSNATAEKIPELLKPGVLNTDTKAVLANAIYLKASWEKAFETLEDRKFFSLASADKAKMVKFFTRTAYFNYAGNDDYEIVEIPYKDAPISMIMIKAKAANTGVSAVESKFGTNPPKQLWASARRRKVALTVPRFTIRLSTGLTETLARLGMGTMFSNLADFTRMDPINRIRVTNVVHEAFIKVNENGTEAAAATAVTFESRSMAPPEEPIPFTLDYPFLFTIVHHPTKAILFAGKVNTIENPQ